MLRRKSGGVKLLVKSAPANQHRPRRTERKRRHRLTVRLQQNEAEDAPKGPPRRTVATSNQTRKIHQRDVDDLLKRKTIPPRRRRKTTTKPRKTTTITKSPGQMSKETPEMSQVRWLHPLQSTVYINERK